MCTPFLQPGRNCWRHLRADRFALLIDGEACFRAVREAILQAEHAVYILAWDIHSEVRMLRDDAEGDGYPAELGPFLEAVLKKRPHLHIHILNWDFSMIYVAERESPLSSRFSDPPERLHFHADDALPMNVSHHQKIMVIDDAVAFVGGLDLSIWRWDSTEHLHEDERRIDTDGEPYQPFHDTQSLVTGEAARALGDLFRERWHHATQEQLAEPPERLASPPWPPSVKPDLEDAQVGIARTRSRHESLPALEEIRQLHLDAIASAKDYLYLENQYLSSGEIAEAIGERLREPKGPETVILLTRDSDGWLEQNTMGLLRNRLLERLREADLHDRLRVYYPEAVGGSGRRPIYLHSKIFIADDRMLKVGSSNLSNRSMKVDTECDLILVFDQANEAIREMRDRLIAHYFHQSPSAFRKAVDAAGTLTGGIESLITTKAHSLQPLPFGCENNLQRKIADSQILDPDEPLDPGHWLESTVPTKQRASVLRRMTLAILGISVVLALAVLFERGWGGLLDQETVAAQIERIQQHTWAPALLVGVFFAGGLSGFSINLLLVTAALVMGPIYAIGAGLVGAHLSALAGFLLGKRFGKPLVARISSKDVESLSRWIGRLGIPGVALARLVPVAPFVIVNLIAGASQLRLNTFHWGSLLGLIPGMLVVVLLTDRMRAMVRDPDWGTAISLALVVALAVSAVVFVRRKLGRGHASAQRR